MIHRRCPTFMAKDVGAQQSCRSKASHRRHTLSTVSYRHCHVNICPKPSRASMQATCSRAIQRAQPPTARFSHCPAHNTSHQHLARTASSACSQSRSDSQNVMHHLCRHASPVPSCNSGIELSPQQAQAAGLTEAQQSRSTRSSPSLQIKREGSARRGCGRGRQRRPR